MNDKTIELVEKYGNELAKKLNVAITEVYPRVLLYVRLLGVVHLVNAILVGIIVVAGLAITHRLAKKLDLYSDKFDDLQGAVMLWAAAVFFITMLCVAVFPAISSVTKSIAQIVWPEFYLIDQLIGGHNEGRP